jgi:hypothetical protein
MEQGHELFLFDEAPTRHSVPAAMAFPLRLAGGENDSGFRQIAVGNGERLIMHSNTPRRSMPSLSSFAICFSSCCHPRVA